jgi:hypothetical protein
MRDEKRKAIASPPVCFSAFPTPDTRYPTPCSLATPERRRDYEEFCEDVFHRDDDEVVRKRLELAWLRGMGDLYRRISRGEEPGYGLLPREGPPDTGAAE